MLLVFMIGTAGSGKSRLTAAFTEWLRESKQDFSTVNLDPGALTLPYSPDVDVRNYVDIESLMQKYNLGPNGALVMAADMVADEIEKLSKEIDELGSDIVLVDTSGQMELFAFRASGPYIASELTKNPKALVYLFDAVFCVNPQSYVSNMFLATAVYNRFVLPQIYILSKTDLLPKAEVERIVDWSARPEKLQESIDEKLEGTRRLLSRNMARIILQLGLAFPLIPVSSKTNEGMVNLNTALERILMAGEKYTD